MSKEMSRRDLLKMSGLAAAGVAGASLLGGCAPKAASSASDSGKAANGGSTAATTAAGHERAGLPSFLSAPEPIKDVKTTKDYDVVIVGAGAAGIPAAITAKEAGASVAVIQKESTAISQGNTATGILLDKSDPAGVEAVVSKLISEHDYRAKREQVELWAKNSGEAITWLFNLAQQCGAQVSDTTKKWTSGIAKVNDYEMNYLSIDFGPKPYNTGEGMKALAEYAEKQGVDFFYSTEAKQLVGDASGITGVIAKGAEGNIQFNAKKGVILAAGDYQNDDEMVNYYLPDLKHLGRKQTNKTGDGHKMAMKAGAGMQLMPYAKIYYNGLEVAPGVAKSTLTGNANALSLGAIMVNKSGKRVVDEKGTGRSIVTVQSKSEGNQLYLVMDEPTFKIFRDGIKNNGVSPAEVDAWLAKNGKGTPLFAHGKTLAEAAKNAGLNADNLVATVKRYNGFVKSGKDEDFGRKPENMKAAISDQGPYYIVEQKPRFATTMGSVQLSESLQVLDKNGKPIGNLYAAGEIANCVHGDDSAPAANVAWVATSAKLASDSAVKNAKKTK